MGGAGAGLERSVRAECEGVKELEKFQEKVTRKEAGGTQGHPEDGSYLRL